MKAAISVFIIAFGFTTLSADAQFLKKVGIGGGKGNLSTGSRSGANISGLVGSQGDLLQQYITAKANLAESNGLVAESLGMKKEAAAYRATAKKLSSGNVKSKKQLKKHTKTSDKANKEINEKLDKNEDLSDESKELMSDAMGKYGISLAESRILLMETKPYWEEVKRVITNSSAIEKVNTKRKLDDGIFVSRKTPGHVRDLMTTMNKIRRVAKSQNIKLPEDATKDLDDIKTEDVEELEEL